MTKTIVKIEGMMCGMCEKHVTEAIKNAAKVKKVTSSHENGTSEIISETAPDENILREAVEGAGYKVTAISSEPYEKRGLF